MKNVMVDLETLGQTPGCSILSIGAVAFDEKTKMLGQEFYKVVSNDSCEAAGLTIDSATLDWWDRQSEEARRVLEQSNDPELCLSLKYALEEFNIYLSQFNTKSLYVWGNGASFDNAILICAYRAVGVEPVWKYWNDRCYRTLKALAPEVKLNRKGTFHNALDDAKTQAEHAIEIFTCLEQKERDNSKAA